MATNQVTKNNGAAVATAERTRGGSTFTPRVDILESKDELTLFADLPGVTPENLDVRFENGELVIHGACAARHEGADHLLREYGVGDFHREFTVSEAINAEAIHAELKQGVLTVHLPKSEKVKPRRIAVQSA